MVAGVFINWLFNFFSTVFSGSTGKVIEGVLDITRTVIGELETDPNFLTNADKRQAAFDRIRSKALEEGREVSSHAINLAIELAVAELRR